MGVDERDVMDVDDRKRDGGSVTQGPDGEDVFYATQIESIVKKYDAESNFRDLSGITAKITITTKGKKKFRPCFFSYGDIPCLSDFACLLEPLFRAGAAQGEASAVCRN